MAKIKAPKLETRPGGEMVMLSLKGSTSVLKAKKIPDHLLEALVARHPVVTSLRCNQGRVIDPGFTTGHLNPYPFYNGDYNLDCIPRCSVLVGYDCTIFDTAFNIVYNVRKTGVDLLTGVGEIVLVPM
ncbi:hypothetical protein SELMODRAFT_421895 [Selaginella moellendorffii]|uniref:Uncharacterized protein n=1 Tax=Selaginella moellendorffii TaxID=88036 RepID=D8SGP3_SELML|nr:hypothetical protein SELMODRAFT_421895 [Selaginella moellendorffii]